MPELPELQALAERLAAAFARQSLGGLDLLHFSALKTVAPSPEDLKGRSLKSVGRRGKYLIFDFGDSRILTHLSQGGRVEFEQPGRNTRPKRGVARLKFEQGSTLIHEYGTERKAALWILDRDDAGPLAKLGPEPYDDAFEELLLTGADRRHINTLLRDQRTVAGIGRGFSDDILHEGKLSPYETLSSMDAAKRKELLRAIRAVLDRATEAERERTGGLPPKLRDRFTIHGRFGSPCPRCGDEMKRISYESREITYCPRCQTGGKVLADRRLSRLLR